MPSMPDMWDMDSVRAGGPLPPRPPASPLTTTAQEEGTSKESPPTPTSGPLLLGDRARAGGADKGAGAWPGTQPGGPSSPPLHGRGSA